jgi:hypothetical protein
MDTLDGNAIAGGLFTAFGHEMTVSTTQTHGRRPRPFSYRPLVARGCPRPTALQH